MPGFSSLTWDIFFQAAYLVTHDYLSADFNFQPTTKFTFVRANLTLVRLRYMTLCGLKNVPPTVCEPFFDYLAELDDAIFTVNEFSDIRYMLMFYRNLPPPQ